MDHHFGGGEISYRISIDPMVESATPHVCLRLGMVTTCLFSGPVGFGPYGPEPNRPRLGDPTT